MVAGTQRAVPVSGRKRFKIHSRPTFVHLHLSSPLTLHPITHNLTNQLNIFLLV